MNFIVFYFDKRKKKPEKDVKTFLIDFSTDERKNLTSIKIA